MCRTKNTGPSSRGPSSVPVALSHCAAGGSTRWPHGCGKSAKGRRTDSRPRSAPVRDPETPRRAAAPLRHESRKRSRVWNIIRMRHHPGGEFSGDSTRGPGPTCLDHGRRGPARVTCRRATGVGVPGGRRGGPCGGSSTSAAGRGTARSALAGQFPQGPRLIAVDQSGELASARLRARGPADRGLAGRVQTVRGADLDQGLAGPRPRGTLDLDVDGPCTTWPTPDRAAAGDLRRHPSRAGLAGGGREHGPAALPARRHRAWGRPGPRGARAPGPRWAEHHSGDHALPWVRTGGPLLGAGPGWTGVAEAGVRD